jgi:integrase
MDSAFKPTDMFQYKTAQRLFNNIRESSRAVFSIGLARYCTYLQMTPDAIYEDRRKTVRQGIVDNDIEIQRSHEEKYAGFAKFLQEIKQANGAALAPNTIQSNMTAAAAFYSRNYFPLQKPDRPDAYNVRPLHTPTAEEIGKMLEVVKDDPLKMGVIAGAFQTAMGAGDLTKILWNDISDTYGSLRDQFKSGLRVGDKIYRVLHFQRVRGKTHVRFDTFAGHLTTSILSYKDYPMEDRVFPISVRYFEKVVEDASKEVNLPGQTTPHSLRKSFSVSLKMQNVNNDLVESWMAHSIGQVRGAYFKPPPSEQLKMYLQIEKFLTPPQFASVLND